MRKMNWWQVSIVLSSYGFFKEYRPSEPFITPYLTRFKNFTIEQINQDIYPTGTYVYLCLLVAVFLLTDFLKYKPVLLAGGFSAVITWCLLIYGHSIEEMQVVEFFYGLFMASEVAYFTYMYAKVDTIHYQKVTSHARAAFLLGKASAGLSSQLFVYFSLLDYLQLNYLTVLGVALATVSGFFLPSVQRSLYFHRDKDEKCDDFEITEIKKGVHQMNIDKKPKEPKCRAAFQSLFEDFKEAFTSRRVLQWSVWWALATCGFLQVISYAQLLWEDITKEDDTLLYHGYVECATSLLGAAVTFCIGYLQVPWNVWGEVSLGVVTIAQGCVLFYCAYLNELYLAYIMHVVYQVLYHAAITVANYEVAKFIKDRSYALVFGINTFLALVIQTILTMIVIQGMKINIRSQFLVYGGYHVAIGVAFLVAGILTLACFKVKARSNAM